MYKYIKYLFFCFLLTVLIVSCGISVNENAQIYLNPDESTDKRVEDLLSRMTLEEKLGQMNLDWTAEEVNFNESITSDGEADTGATDISENSYDRLLKDISSGKVGITRNIIDWEDANTRQKAAEESRLKIPLFIIQNAVHGAGVDHSTIFPVNLAMAGTFDPELVKKSAKIIARECRALGFNWTFSPTLDIARDARWGRCGETFGEDPNLVSEMGVAMVRGLQGNDMRGTDHVASCLKHFVAGGQPLNGLNFAPVEYTERSLREDFFPPFKIAVDAGAWSVMPAHQDIGGVPCHASAWLLNDVLRNEWGFKGVVVTDWMDMERLVTLHKVAATFEDALDMAINAGVDIHNNGRVFIEPMKILVKQGKISEKRIDRTVRAILEAKFKLGLFENRYVDNPFNSGKLLSEEARAIAYEMAVKSAVLLKNEKKTLPLKSDRFKNILITGPYAHSNAILGDWIRHTNPENITTYIDEGIINKAGENFKINILNCGQSFNIPERYFQEVKNEVEKTDLVVLVIGGSDYRAEGFQQYQTGGENHARQSIDLAGNQLEYAKTIISTGVPVVVVLVNGRPLNIEWLNEHCDAILESWCPGMEGGNAIADILYGNVNPSGKLPITIPRSTGQLHVWYNHKPATFFREYQFGKTGPLFEFGYGLSYTEFTYSNLFVPEKIVENDEFTVSVDIENTGEYHGDEVVLLYLNDELSSLVTPVRKLLAFERLSLSAGEKKTVNFSINADQLAFWNADMKYCVEPGEFTFFAGNLSMKTELFYK